MIQIERLRMHLPAGFEHRATAISRLVGEALANKHLSQERVIEAISLRSQRVALNSTDSEIADLIVKQVVTAIEGSVS